MLENSQRRAGPPGVLWEHRLAGQWLLHRGAPLKAVCQSERDNRVGLQQVHMVFVRTNGCFYITLKLWVLRGVLTVLVLRIADLVLNIRPQRW